MRGRVHGFTLVELLIALTLISMALAIAFAALRIAARSMESTELLVNELEELRVVRTVMQQQLVQARPLHESATQRQVNFHGESRQLEFVAPAPSQDGRLMGLYRYRLSIDAVADRQQLLLAYQPYVPGVAHDWPLNGETTLLASDLRQGEFSYFGVGAQGEAWQSRWSGQERLPRLVRLVLVRDVQNAAPLELVVALPAERGG